MHSLLLQVIAVTTINLKSISQRFWLSLSTVTAVALVVMVLLAFLAMANGFQRTLTGAGSLEVAIVLRGVGQEGAAVRKGITIVEGRMFNTGANEIVVGKGLQREFQGFDLNQTVAFGK